MMTPEFRKNAAILINNLIKADGEIRREEVDAAYAYLNGPSEDGEPRPWSSGDNAVVGRRDSADLSTAIGALRYAPEEDRMHLLAAMWDVAAADGEIADSETEFVRGAAEALDLPMSTVEIIRPPMFGAAADAKAGDELRKKAN